MSVNRGFTLIEILVVIVIVGITLGVALIAFGDFGGGRRIVLAAEQLVNVLKFVQEEAILETSTFGLRLDNTSYQILKFQDSGEWKPVSNKGVFKVNYFPQNAMVKLITSTTMPKGAPAIIIEASGDMTPFTMTFGTQKEPVLVTITGRHDGSFIMNTAKTK